MELTIEQLSIARQKIADHFCGIGAMDIKIYNVKNKNLGFSLVGDKAKYGLVLTSEGNPKIKNGQLQFEW